MNPPRDLECAEVCRMLASYAIYPGSSCWGWRMAIAQFSLGDGTTPTRLLISSWGVTHLCPSRKCDVPCMVGLVLVVGTFQVMSDLPPVVEANECNTK